MNRTAVVATKSLPTMLKNLCHSTGLRTLTVTGELQRGPATISTHWRHGPPVSLGKVVASSTKYLMGSDGESNSSTETTYSLPVAIPTPKCGRGTKNEVHLVIGNLGDSLSLDTAELTPEFLAVCLDLSLIHI